MLAKLPQREYEQILPHLESVFFKQGKVIYESGSMNYVYFPTTAVIFLLCPMEDGTSVEIGIVGNEGMVDIALFMGGGARSNRAIVQSAGSALRMKAKALQHEFRLGGMFQRRLLLYTQALMTQVSQTAACNRLHSVEQHLCRWLLLSHDRLESNELIMTQELIANTLGVRREGITRAAQRLQANGLISYGRGRIRILDRVGLEAAVCECYRVVKDEYDRLLN